MWRATSAAALLLALALPARAERCAHAPAIAAMSRAVLSARAELTGFAPRQVGTLPAYLLLHYGDLPEAEARALLDDLVAAKVRDAADLRDTREIAREGPAAWAARRGLANGGVLAATGPSAWRAILLADSGETFFRLLAAARAASPGDPRLGALLGGGAPLPALLSDQTDAALLAMAGRAEAAGALVPALLMLADRSDLGAFRAFLARHAADPAVAAVGGAGHLHGHGVSLRHDTGPLNPDRYPDAGGRQMQRDFYSVARAAYLSGSADFLNITLNQTGETAALARAAGVFLSALAAGGFDPVRDPEAGWLSAYTALAFALGRERTQAALSGFDWPTRQVRHFAGRAVGTLDRVVAKAALRAFLDGGEAPPRPLLLSPGADWEGWLRIARTVREGGPVADADIPVAVELLTLRGDWAGAAALAGRLPARARVDALADLARRLDLLCGQWTASPGQAMLLAGAVLWRFPSSP